MLPIRQASELDRSLGAALERLLLADTRAHLTDHGVTLAPPHTRLLRDLSSAEWQLVTGRRGTGKTHLARAFCEAINDRQDPRFAALPISAESLLVSPIGVQLTARRRARSSFQLLVDQVVAQLGGLTAERFDGRGPRFGRRGRLYEDVARSLNEMQEAAEEGYALTAGGETTFDEILDASRVSERSRELGLSAGVDLRSVTGEARAGLTRSRSRRSAEQLKQTSTYPGAAPLFDIGRALEHVLELLRVTCLFIVVDSVTSLGIDGDPDIQAFFLADVHRAFGGVGMVSVKLFANPYQLHLQTATGRGLELDAEIAFLADLDTLLLDHQPENLASILDRHLEHHGGAGGSTGIEALFESPEAYQTLLFGFGTNVSNLLSAIRRLVRYRAPSRAAPWTTHEVMRIVDQSLRLAISHVMPERVDLLRRIVRSIGDNADLGIDAATERRHRTDLADLAERGFIDPQGDLAWMNGLQVVALGKHVRLDRSANRLEAERPILVLPDAVHEAARTSSSIPRQCPNCEAEDSIVKGSTGRLMCKRCFEHISRARAM